MPVDAARAVPATPPPPWEADASSVDGPHAIPWESGRPIWWAAPRAPIGKPRLIGHLHGMCGPPSYACGRWMSAGTSFGIMVCPTGNARCGDPGIGPASWEAPSWPELVGIMDHDLEAAIAKVSAKTAIDREGAVLTGYSRGGFATPVIARRHPGRWPYLVVIEANVPLSVADLKASGVRAIALVAGEQGTELAGMQRTTAALEGAGFPATLVVMRRTGHPYSEDMEYVMRQALEFLFEKRDAGP